MTIPSKYVCSCDYYSGNCKYIGCDCWSFWMSSCLISFAKKDDRMVSKLIKERWLLQNIFFSTTKTFEIRINLQRYFYIRYSLFSLHTIQLIISYRDFDNSYFYFVWFYRQREIKSFFLFQGNHAPFLIIKLFPTISSDMKYFCLTNVHK